MGKFDRFLNEKKSRDYKLWCCGGYFIRVCTSSHQKQDWKYVETQRFLLFLWININSTFDAQFSSQLISILIIDIEKYFMLEIVAIEAFKWFGRAFDSVWWVPSPTVPPTSFFANGVAWVLFNQISNLVIGIRIPHPFI